MPKNPFDFSNAAADTDRDLADELALRTTLSADDIHRLLPTRVDKQQLKTLIQLVSSATNDNERVAGLRSNFTEVGGAVVSLLKAIIR